LTDREETVRDLTDSTGVLKNHIEYSAFGTIVSQTNPAFSSNYLWQGQVFNGETVLWYERRRYYDPATGRFLSQDPAGLAADDNGYRYVHNMPTNATDPNGRWLFADNEPIADVWMKDLSNLGLHPRATPFKAGDGNFYFYIHIPYREAGYIQTLLDFGKLAPWQRTMLKAATGGSGFSKVAVSDDRLRKLGNCRPIRLVRQRRNGKECNNFLRIPWATRGLVTTGSTSSCLRIPGDLPVS
jgi:RHS repeat-associated protein